ncbi:AtpZ/AtpI family protein [Fervidobacterium pennivorans subsp. shakshaketiis]|uniref:F0F1-ATPase subunit (ATPase_gene1) n=1 Tax=Fervidobacterium pennivorans (strain DSM 9078 / Ven5) TaxID=771875 RepID=H9UB93_FERPD|nr:Putative F0F1-ATPase subunit (ATPase_gene1) [Fervidobacterium pennivorans DSM 9078]
MVGQHSKGGQKPHQGKGIGKELSKLNLISSLGFTIIANILVGFVLGAFLDNLFSTARLFKIVFIVLGTLSGVYNGIKFLIKELERYDKIDSVDSGNNRATDFKNHEHKHGEDEKDE